MGWDEREETEGVGITSVVNERRSIGITDMQAIVFFAQPRVIR